MKHDAIIATAWDKKRLSKARRKAISLKLPVSPIVDSPINGQCSFLIAPDGSKEGWEDSKRGEEARAKWIAWVRAQKDFWIDWILVRFGGDDDHRAGIVDHSGLPHKDEE